MIAYVVYIPDIFRSKDNRSPNLGAKGRPHMNFRTRNLSYKLILRSKELKHYERVESISHRDFNVPMSNGGNWRVLPYYESS